MEKSESNDSENDSDDNISENIVDREDGIRVDKNSDSLKQPAKRKRRLSVTSKGSVEAESQSEPDDDFLGDDSPEEAEDKEEHDLAELLEASSTIRFAPKRQISEHKLTKAKQKQEVMLEMLSTDLIDSDPQRDERDTALAQSYLHKVQDTLANDPEKYAMFRHLLAEFDSSDKTPVQLYQDIEALFDDHPELVSDFSGFLLPDQALECSCLATNREFTKARVFLRKLEVLLKKHPSHLQRILKVFAQWQNSPTKDVRHLKDAVQPLLKGNQHLLDEFSQFFPEEKPLESHITDFEEIYFADSEGEDEKVDDFEEVVIREDAEEDMFGTSQCRCFCHNSKDQIYLHRKKHCTSCAVKIIKGKLYLQADKHLRPAKVVFLESTLQNEAGYHGDTADEDSDKEDNSNSRTNFQFLQNKEKSDKGRQKTLLWKGQKIFRGSGLGSYNLIESSADPDRGMSKKGSLSPFHYTDESAVATPESYSEDTQKADAMSDNERIGPTDFSSLRLEINKGQQQLQTQNNQTIGHPNEPHVEGCDTTKTADNESPSNITDFTIVARTYKEETLENTGGSTLSYTEKSSEVVDNTCDSNKRPEPVTCDAEDESDQVKDERDTGVGTELGHQNRISVSQSVATPSVVVEQRVQTSEDMNKAQNNTETSLAQSDRASNDVDVPKTLSWTREEDKMILETCKRDGPVPDTFAKIAETLKMCNPQEAQGRFLSLMQMFMDENSDTTETETEQED